MSESKTAELLPFLTPSARPDVKGQATGFLLGLSGNRYEADGHCEENLVGLISFWWDVVFAFQCRSQSESFQIRFIHRFRFDLYLNLPKYLCFFVFRDGCQVLRSKPDVLAALFALTSDISIAVAKDCYFIFVNLSADPTLHEVIGPDILHVGEHEASLTVNKSSRRRTHRETNLLPVLSSLLQAQTLLQGGCI